MQLCRCGRRYFEPHRKASLKKGKAGQMVKRCGLCRAGLKPPGGVGSTGGKGLGKGSPMSLGVASMLSAFGMNVTKVPFYRKLFTGRRRG